MCEYCYGDLCIVNPCLSLSPLSPASSRPNEPRRGVPGNGSNLRLETSREGSAMSTNKFSRFQNHNFKLSNFFGHFQNKQIHIGKYIPVQIMGHKIDFAGYIPFRWHKVGHSTRPLHLLIIYIFFLEKSQHKFK